MLALVARGRSRHPLVARTAERGVPADCRVPVEGDGLHLLEAHVRTIRR
jgi:hypothetical protein